MENDEEISNNFHTPTGPNIVISDGSSFSEKLSFSVTDDPLRSVYKSSSEDEPFYHENKSNNPNEEEEGISSHPRDPLGNGNSDFEEENKSNNPNEGEEGISSHPRDPLGNGNSDFEEEDEIVHDFTQVVTESSSSSSSSSNSEYLIVKVMNPQREYEEKASFGIPGGNVYVTYLFVTQTNIPDFGGEEFRVRRRFRDVVGLGDRLAQTYKGFFVPPRPDKSIVESQVMQKNEFIEQRRKALERYLNRLCGHPVIRRSKELICFLQTEGSFEENGLASSRHLDRSNSFLSSSGNSQQAKGGKDVFKMWKDLKKIVSNEWSGPKSPAVEEDKEFLKWKLKMEELEQHLTQASKQAEVLVKSQQDLGEAMGRVGLAFIKLSKFESEGAISNTQKFHSSDIKHIGTSAVKASRLYREANAESVKNLGQLHEYLWLMQAIHTAFSDRSEALSALQNLMSEMSSMKAHAGIKAAELSENVRVLERKIDMTMKEYQCIKENNKKELRRFESEKRSNFMNMIKGFVQSQVVYSEKIADLWENAAEDCRGYAGRSELSPNFHE